MLLKTHSSLLTTRILKINQTRTPSISRIINHWIINMKMAKKMTKKMNINLKVAQEIEAVEGPTRITSNSNSNVQC